MTELEKARYRSRVKVINERKRVLEKNLGKNDRLVQNFNLIIEKSGLATKKGHLSSRPSEEGLVALEKLEALQQWKDIQEPLKEELGKEATRQQVIEEAKRRRQIDEKIKEKIEYLGISDAPFDAMDLPDGVADLLKKSHKTYAELYEIEEKLRQAQRLNGPRVASKFTDED